MEFSHWLKGGSFLEVSFLLELSGEKKKTVQHIIDKLSVLTNKIEIVDNNINEILNYFESGYAYDEENPHSYKIHMLRLKLFVNFSRKRKATFQIEQVSSNSLLINFWFFGDKFDAPEFDQIGIKENEFLEFTTFLMELYKIYEFKVGGISFEGDVLGLFDCNEEYPNECYRFENVTPNYFLKETSDFINIIWNENYSSLNNVPFKYNKLENSGILIMTSRFIP